MGDQLNSTAYGDEPTECVGCAQRSANLDRLRAALAEAERERDEARAEFERHKTDPDPSDPDGWIRRSALNHWCDRATRAEAALEEARRVLDRAVRINNGTANAISSESEGIRRSLAAIDKTLATPTGKSPDPTPSASRAPDGPAEARTTTVGRDHCNRCDRCGGPLAETAAHGCRPFKCSIRPLPFSRATCAGCGAPFDDAGKEGA